MKDRTWDWLGGVGRLSQEGKPAPCVEEGGDDVWEVNPAGRLVQIEQVKSYLWICRMNYVWGTQATLPIDQLDRQS